MKKRVFLLGFVTMLVNLLIVGWTLNLTNAAEKVINWKMTSTWTPGMLHIEADKHFLKIVNEMVGNELKIKFFEGGSLIPPYEVFDAVAKGTVDAAGDWGGYWAGKDAAFDPLGGLAMGLSPIDFLVWIQQAGGFELYQEIYGKFGIVYFPYYLFPMESGIRSKKPINSVADYKGKKIRMAGQTAGLILKDLGGIQVNLAGGEVYQALERGIIDAAEMSMPATDWALGLQEITKFWSVPNWVNPAAVGGIMIGKKPWDDLPDHLKATIKAAATANLAWTFAYYEFNAIDGTKKFLDKGIKVTRLSDADIKKLQEISNKIALETCKRSPTFAKVIYSQYKYLKDVAQWRNMASPFSYGRNPVLPDLEAIKAYIK
jgi:TRAP-type mannitol/chloroaromatic compound transport system substrate-binding protein